MVTPRRRRRDGFVLLQRGVGCPPTPDPSGATIFVPVSWRRAAATATTQAFVHVSLALRRRNGDDATHLSLFC